jgi:oxysterol 7-alpha-hydroxylase
MNPSSLIHEAWVARAILFVGTLVLAQVARAYFLSKAKHGRRMFGEDGPPCVPYIIPYLGSALEMRKNPLKFVAKWKEAFGSYGMFGFYSKGTRIVVVTDPDAAAYLTNGRIPQLSFQLSKYLMLRNSMRVTDEAARFISQQNKTHVIIHRHLLEKRELSNMIYDWQTYFTESYFPSALKREGGKRVSINQFFGECIFCATAKLFFGETELASKEHFDHAITFDRAFAPMLKMSSEMYQRLWYPDETKAREKYVASFQSIFEKDAKNNPNVCKMFKELEEVVLPDVSKRDRVRYFALLMFASILNTVPTTFWVVYYLISSDGALSAVQNEIDAIVDKREACDKSKLIFSLQEMDEMKCIDSLMTETLRLKSTAVAFRFRRATRDFDISLNVKGKAKKFRVEKNDLFLICPTLVHLDPNVYSDPEIFKWDRFLDNPEGTSPIVSKDGVKVSKPLDAFGGGQSLCPGRKFARCEIKAAVASLVLQYDIAFAGNVIPDPPALDTGKSLTVNGTPVSDVEIELTPR